MESKTKIINDDFRNHIAMVPDNSLIITDPPYNINYKYLEYKDNMEDDEYANIFKAFGGRRVVTIHYPEDTIKYIIPALGIPNEIVTWVYPSNISRQHRMIAWFNCMPDFSMVKQPYKNIQDKRVQQLIKNGSTGCDIYDWWEIDLVKNVSSEKTSYTNQIPEEVIYRIIKTTATKGDVIVDPFLGSGTTCVVAHKLAHDCIGMDISRKACEIAKKRIADIWPLFNQKHEKKHIDTSAHVV